jgi:DNA-binding HxlR family transcriptional regulator
MVEDGPVKTYRQYCPVARASEILAERWTLLIVRNLMFGANTFSSIARGVPTMSRSMLAKRLRELERDGIVVSTPKSNGRGSTYALTGAGADLAEVVDSMGRWAETWVEVLPRHADPGFALWAWCHVQMSDRDLPAERTVVRFHFPDETPGNQHFWLLIDNGDAELCVTDPGDEPALRVTARSVPFVDWHRGAVEWDELIRHGDVRFTGRRELARALPSWNTRKPVIVDG